MFPANSDFTAVPVGRGDLWRAWRRPSRSVFHTYLLSFTAVLVRSDEARLPLPPAFPGLAEQPLAPEQPEGGLGLLPVSTFEQQHAKYNMMCTYDLLLCGILALAAQTLITRDDDDNDDDDDDDDDDD